jgi:Rap guanine nucleotide exchange factor 4
VHSRSVAIGMWQALLEEGTIAHVNRDHCFKDKYLFYRFTINDDWILSKKVTPKNKSWEDQLQDTILLLAQIGSDATLRMILRTPPQERTVNDLEIIYEDLVHVKALSHLSSVIKIFFSQDELIVIKNKLYSLHFVFFAITFSWLNVNSPLFYCSKFIRIKTL